MGWLSDWFFKPEIWWQRKLEKACIHFADLMQEPSIFVMVDDKKKFRDQDISVYALRIELEASDIIIEMSKRKLDYQSILKRLNYTKYLREYDTIMQNGPNRPIWKYLRDC